MDNKRLTYAKMLIYTHIEVVNVNNDKELERVRVLTCLKSMKKAIITGITRYQRWWLVAKLLLSRIPEVYGAQRRNTGEKILNV